MELPDTLVPDTSETLVSIPDFYRMAIPAAATLVSAPGQVGPVEFRWPAFAHAYGLLLVPAAGLGSPDAFAASLAKLSLEIFDTHEKPIFKDGRGFLSGVQQPNAVGAMALFGQGMRPFAIDRPVRPHDRWTFTVKNAHTAIITVASLVVLVRNLQR